MSNTKLTTEEGNKLIAEFMGGVRQIIPIGGLHGYKEGTELWFGIFSSNPDATSYLDFHESWDWLMPVVEKIENLQFIKGWVSEGQDKITLTYHKDAVWEQVVKFILWYNQKQ